MSTLTAFKSTRFLSGIMALMMAIQPSLSYGKWDLPSHKPDFEGQAFEGADFFARPSEAVNDVEWSEYLSQQAQNAEPTNIQKVTNTGENLIDLMVDYKNFFAESLRKIDEDIKRLGYDHWFHEKLEANKVNYTDPELGLMEFTNIDGQPVGKIVHEKSGVAFLVYDEKRVKKSSKHFQQYVARQHYDAGSTRDNGRYIDENGKKRKVKAGRDLLIMGIDGDIVGEDGIEISPRKRGIKQWWKATYKNPTKHDKVMGFISGLAQFGSVYALAEMVSWVLPGFENGSKPAMLASFTLAYGAVLGIWNSFYQNWRKRGGRMAITLKNMSVSLTYYFGVFVISSGGLQQITLNDMSIDPGQATLFMQNLLNSVSNVSVDSIMESGKQALQSVGNLGMLGIAAAVHPFHNFLANNEFKNWTLWRQSIPEIERTDRHNLKVPIPFLVKNEEGKLRPGIKKVETPMSQRFWNRQFLYYMPVNWTKFIDQVWFSTTIGPAMMGELPWFTPILSMVGFWGITVGAIRHTNWMAYKKHEQAANELKIREHSRGYYPMQLMKDMVSYTKWKLGWSNKKPGGICDDLLLHDDTQ